MSLTEATSSAILRALNTIIVNPIFAYITGALGGIVISLLGKFGEARIAEFFEEKKRKKTIKIQAAADINSFVVEGMHSGFSHKAGSEKHIKLRAMEIQAIDERVGQKLIEFLTSWMQHRNLLKYERKSLENDKSLIIFRDKAQKLGEDLLKTAKNWNK